MTITLPFDLPLQDGWRIATLDQCCRSITDGDWIETKDQGGTDYRLLQVSNIGVGSFVEKGSFRYVTEDTFQRLRCTAIESGDILISRMPDPVGRAWCVASLPWKAITAVDVAIVRTKATVLNPRFCTYYLNSPFNLSNAAARASGTTRLRITRRDLASFPIPVPPLPIQHKIASILSAYDDLIENNTRRIAILEAMAQAIYREWFVEFRFPGHEKVKLVDSSLGKIPEGWKASPLSDIADVNALSIKKGKEPDEVNYVDIASVSTGTIDEVRLLPFSEAPGRARRIVRHGDLIWSTVRPNRKSYSLILNPLPNMIVSTGFAVISGTKAPFSYLYHALTTDDFVGYLVNHATGSAYPAVNSGDFEKANILVPTQDILDAFDDATNGMFLLKHNLQEKNRRLRTTRDLLLPKLISGELDVEDLDIETGEAVTE